MLISTDPQVLLIAALSVVAVVVLAVVWGSSRSTRRRHAELKQRFGPEYFRAVEEYGDVRRAERALLAREKRVQHLRLRELAPAERVQFEATWTGVQARFVDDPSGAVRAAPAVRASMMTRKPRRRSVADRSSRAGTLAASVLPTTAAVLKWVGIGVHLIGKRITTEARTTRNFLL